MNKDQTAEAISQQDRTPRAEEAAAYKLVVTLRSHFISTISDQRFEALVAEAFKAHAAAVSAKAVKAERERCAQVAEKMHGGYLCPYGRDEPGDPTWDHTDKDKCPVCGGDGETSLTRCHDTASGRIASAIRTLTDDTAPQAARDETKE